jgi:hypothetical protein
MTSGATSDLSSVGAYIKILIGLLLPVGLCIAAIAVLFERYSSQGLDYGIAGVVKVWLVCVPGIPGVLVMNSLLMVRQWRSVGTVCLVGLIFPALLVLAAYCRLGF